MERTNKQVGLEGSGYLFLEVLQRLRGLKTKLTLKLWGIDEVKGTILRMIYFTVIISIIFLIFVVIVNYY